MTPSASLSTLLLVSVTLLLGGCSALFPSRLDTAQRLDMLATGELPLDRPVTIRWNARMVPYIEAETDHDAAFALGLVHGHLRGAQIALLKRISAGRLSEMAGPLANDIDHALRILGFGRAAADIEAALPPESRDWMEAFVAGLNHQQAMQRRQPPEFALLGITPEPYTVRDLLTIGRLAGTDVNWLAYFSILDQRGQRGFPALWRRVLEAGTNSTTSFRATTSQAALSDILSGFSKSGSNSVAVSASRSASGGALIANDPHLGLNLPNLWLLVGLRSPSYQAVGMMIPGLPFIAVGRSPHMAWGGTNMRAASSDLYDVGDLPADQFTTEQTTIATRLWFDDRRVLRHTPFGPVISDAAVVPGAKDRPLALRWVGHETTDETTALLRAMRATNPQEFRAAFADFGVSAQNMVFADTKGNIGQIMAVTQPVRSGFPGDDPVLDASDPSTHWQGFVRTAALPHVLNPAEGFVASANNRPADASVPIGFLFSSEDRVKRLKQILAASDRIGIEDLIALQTDTLSPAARRLATALAQRLRDAGAGTALTQILAGWDGDYRIDATAPVAFEALLYHLVPAVYGAETPADLPGIYTQWSNLDKFLIRDLDALPVERRHALLNQAASLAAGDAAQFSDWGDMHKLRLQHVLANLPVLGRFFRIEDVAIGGSRETPMKTAHDLVNTRHAARYGSQARHISDMADPDANYFTLLGGQDGWLGSAHFIDQVALWRESRYIRLPLRPESIAAEFPTVQTLRPMP
ncbi:MAG: penicillin acylase family protein [Alphaproteobacteria bacterium]|nr:penicillin acylase family protein [Alphaproteobacteria bacterium]MBU0797937.1 penicillin acylase family protein [Alphaproteobacteria bacterium]MBU0886111.1 penicillin acylase family protein [Alphaproteobacteria bacterium]MBU1812751.1 penicillin acylase family protein [Alphaproteobacteria bacterium]